MTTWQIQEAKNKFSELIDKTLSEGPQIVTKHGTEVAVVMPSLRIHAPQGKLKGLHSISITLSYRLTIEFLIDDKEIIPLDIETHDRVY